MSATRPKTPIVSPFNGTRTLADDGRRFMSIEFTRSLKRSRDPRPHRLQTFAMP